MHLEVLFRFDRRGRMVRVNEPGGERAPRLHLGRTRQGNLWRFRDDVPDALAAQLADRLARLPFTAEPGRQLEGLGEVRSLLDRHGPIVGTWTGPAWRFPDAIAIAAPAGVERLSAGNRALWRRHFPWLDAELPYRQPCLATVVDGHAVSICFSARLSGEAAEAGVETIAAYRGRGLAPAAVAAWAAAVREEGREPLYCTSFDNVASRRVAETLGLVLYGVDLAFT
jgi:hypothetical protein